MKLIIRHGHPSIRHSRNKNIEMEHLSSISYYVFMEGISQAVLTERGPNVLHVHSQPVINNPFYTATPDL